jgi:hypothetical protein
MVGVRRLDLVAWLLLALMPPQAVALQPADLYRAETIVTGMFEPERTRGFRIGLSEVLLKLTGDAWLAEDPRIAPLMKEPHPLVDAFEYEDRMKDIPVHDEQGTRERPYFLRMRFNAQALDRALAKMGAGKWTERPLTAVWLGVKTEGGAYVLSRSGPEGYGQRLAMIDSGMRLGIPIVLPRDPGASGVAFADVEADLMDKMAATSGDAPAVLLGVLSARGGDPWRIAWHLRWKGRQASWGEEGMSFDVAFRNCMRRLGSYFSGRAPM